MAQGEEDEEREDEKGDANVEGCAEEEENDMRYEIYVCTYICSAAAHVLEWPRGVGMQGVGVAHASSANQSHRVA